MSDWLTETLQTVGSAGAGSFVGWFFTRKKQAQDVKNSELDNVQEAIKIWRETAMELQKRVDEMEKEIKLLREEVATVHAENVRLKQKL